MTLRKNAPRAKHRWVSLVTVVSMAMLLMGTAVLANVGASTFEGGDANLVVNTAGNLDWANVSGRHTGIDLPSGKGDNSFGQGTKEDISDVTVVTGSIPPNKNDLTRFYEASQNIGGHTFLYLAWERAVNIGNANLDFEINQNATAAFTATATGDITLNRTAGDMLVTYDFGGSGTPTLGIRRWTGSAWGAPTTLNGTNSEGAVNTVVIDEVISGNHSLGIGLFGEASIDLTAAGVFPPNTCEHFGSVFVKSRSSSSFPAELKDFIAPEPVDISNCATVITRKATVPAGSTDSFGFTTNVVTEPATTTSPFSLTGATGGNVNTILNVLPGSYNTTEDASTTYTLTSINCAASVMAGAAPATSLANRQATFTVAAGDVVDCTFTNTKNKANPSGTSAPSLIPQDKVTVSDLDTTGIVDGSANKVMTVSLYGATDATCTGSPVYTKTFTVTANTNYVTDNSGVGPSPGGYTITADGTYKWKVHYNGDSRNNGFDIACGAEQVIVNLTPDPA